MKTNVRIKDLTTTISNTIFSLEVVAAQIRAEQVVDIDDWLELRDAILSLKNGHTLLMESSLGSDWSRDPKDQILKD